MPEKICTIEMLLDLLFENARDGH